MLHLVKDCDAMLINVAVDMVYYNRGFKIGGDKESKNVRMKERVAGEGKYIYARRVRCSHVGKILMLILLAEA